MVFAISLFVIAYLIGSLPNALIVGKIAKGIDIREHGSGNLGSTNAVRVLGKRLGLTVFALDVLKGSITVGIAILLTQNYMYHHGETKLFEFSLFKPFYYGIFAIIGHMFPIFAKFKGGKAVATSLGLVLILTPLPALLCLLTFYLTVKISGYVSLASTLAMITVCLSSFILATIWKLDILEVNIFYVLTSVVMIIKHRKNYIRILNGTENSFKKKKEIEEK